MKTGLRLVSPSGRENAPFGWLKDFYDKANAQNVRIDVIGVHWYDWGSNPPTHPMPTLMLFFNRFVNYLEMCMTCIRLTDMDYRIQCQPKSNQCSKP